MIKLFSILLTIFLVGCTVSRPLPKQVVLQDQQGFIQAFDAFRATHQINKLQKFKMDFPDSIWAARAETIILYSHELDQRKAQVEKLRESYQQQALDLEQLRKLNRQLSEKIEQFKSLLIQLEKHSQ